MEDARHKFNTIDKISISMIALFFLYGIYTTIFTNTTQSIVREIPSNQSTTVNKTQPATHKTQRFNVATANERRYVSYTDSLPDVLEYHESLDPYLVEESDSWKIVCDNLTISCYHTLPDGTPAYDERFDYVGPFSEGLAEVVQDGQAFHILPDGTPAYGERFDKVWFFSEGLAEVEQDGQWFHILPDGTPAYDERFDYVWSFSEGLAKVMQDGEYFYIDRYGNRVD